MNTLIKMVKESLYGTANSGLVFRETFNSEADVVKNGGTVTDVSFSNGVASFNGSSSYIKYNSFENFITDNSSFSAFTWIKISEDIHDAVIFNIKEGISGATTKGWQIYFSGTNNVLNTRVADGTYDKTATPTSVLSHNEWHLVGIVLDRKNGKLITAVDGSFTSSGTDISMVGSIKSSTTKPVIGASSVLGRYFTGEIKGAMIFNRVFSEEEFKNLYKGKSYKEFKSSTEILRVDARNGKIDNKYTGDTLGDELQTNPELTGTSGGTNGVGNFTGDIPDNWYIYGTSDDVGTITKNSDGSVTITNISGAFSFYDDSQPVSFVNGKKYRVVLDVISYSGNVNYLCTNNSSTIVPLTSQPITSTGLIVKDFTSTITTVGSLRLSMSTNSSITVRLLSVKEIPPEVTNTDVEVKRNGDIYVMDFNGSTSKVDVGSYDDLTGDITIIGWIKPRSYGELGAGRIFDNGKLILYTLDTNSRYLLTSNASTSAVSTVNSIVLNKWQLLIITRTSNGNTNFYVNGKQNGTTDQDSGTPIAGTTNLFIGNRSSSDRTFDGQISNIRIIKGLLSDEEINQIFTSERRYYNV